jgi:hypothetical protein
LAHSVIGWHSRDHFARFLVRTMRRPQLRFASATATRVSSVCGYESATLRWGAGLPSFQLLGNDVEKRIDLLVVVSPLPDGCFRERHVANLLRTQITSRSIFERCPHTFEKRVDLVFVVTTLADNGTRTALL